MKGSWTASADFAQGHAGVSVDLDQQLVAVLDLLQIGLGNAVFVQGRPGLVDRHRLGELELHGGAAGEIDPHVGGATADLDDADNADDGNDR